MDGHAALKFGVIAKKSHDRLPTLYCMVTNSIKTSIKLDLLPVLVLVKTTTF